MASLEFGGKTRHLKFTIGSIKDLESAMGGLSLAHVINLWQNVGITALVAGLWAAAKHEDPTLTTALVTKMFQQHIEDKRSIRAISSALSQAIDESGILRTEDEASEGNAPKTEAMTV